MILENEIKRLASNVKKLTYATTALLVAVGVLLVATLTHMPARSTEVEEGRFYRSSQRERFEDPKDPFFGFHQWPIDKQLEASTLVLHYKHEVRDDRVVAVIVEVLKRTEGLRVSPGVGDAIDFHIPPSKEGMLADGMIGFFVGPKPSERYAVAIHDSRVTSYSSMPLEDVLVVIRRIVARQEVIAAGAKE